MIYILCVCDMKKNIIKLLSLFICSLAIISSVWAVYKWKWADNPMDTLDSMVSKANVGNYKIQDTALDGISDQNGTYPVRYKISNTLVYIKNNIDPYLQWAVYIWLVAATIALIYMWFLLVTNSVTGAGDLSKLKSRIFHVIIWVLLLTGFYAFLKIVVAIINMVFG